MDQIEIHDEYATVYDNEAEKASWYGPEFMLGMCLEYIEPGQKLLDIGIGTGLSSVPFADYGLNINGIDGAALMLNECKKKGITSNLVHHDLSSKNWPVEKGYDIAISAGVFHFFESLEILFKEVVNLLKPGGIFCFNVMRCRLADLENVESEPKKVIEIPSQSVPIYGHSHSYIEELSDSNGFRILKVGEFLMNDGEEDHTDRFVSDLYVLKKGGK